MFKGSGHRRPPVETLRYAPRTESSLTLDSSDYWTSGVHCIKPDIVESGKHVRFRVGNDSLITDSMRFVDDDLTTTIESVSTFTSDKSDITVIEHAVEEQTAVEKVLSNEYLLLQIMDLLTFEERNRIKCVNKLWFDCATKNPGYGRSFLFFLKSGKMTSVCQLLQTYFTSGLGHVKYGEEVQQGLEVSEDWNGEVLSPVKVQTREHETRKVNFHAKVINYYNNRLAYEWHSLSSMDFKKLFLRYFPEADLRLRQVAGHGFMVALYEDGQEVVESIIPDFWTNRRRYDKEYVQFYTRFVHQNPKPIPFYHDDPADDILIDV